ncbi:MAG: phosphohistidine phosphatase SixA, partial [Gemmatimonadota bacterium]
LDADTEMADGLGPTDDPDLWAGRVQDSNRDTVLVGHLPHLARLASRLLVGDADAGVVEFVNGGVVCLARGEDRGWAVRWAVPPTLVQ